MGKTLDSSDNTSTDIATLQKQLRELQYSETLQHTLYQIASLSHAEYALEDLYKAVHDIVNRAIDAKNFFIALLDEDAQSLTLPYFVDEKDSGDKDMTGVSIFLGHGLSSYVIRTRKPLLLDADKLNHLLSTNEIKEVLGSTDFSSWMGAPMITGESLYGVVVVQSYQENFSYEEKELKLLDFVANQIATAIESNVNAAQRRDAQRRLAEQHRELEQQNIKLNQTINYLEKTQEELVQKEKMAALGGLVAGIAHEINTPLGICVTGVSHLQEELNHIKSNYQQGTLNEQDLVEFFDDLEQGLKILSTNTLRGATLVKSFKQVAVDQSSNEIRTINVKEYIDEIILSLKPRLKRVKHHLIIDCPQDLCLDVKAGALAQIISNLIMNSLLHGFDGIEEGKIRIQVIEKTSCVHLHYADDGIGLSQQALEQLFEPFFTTKRGDGGSGLGTHLIYNLVQSLKGKIKVKSELNKGLAYLISLPKK